MLRKEEVGMRRTNLTFLFIFFSTMFLSLNPLTGLIVIIMLGYFFFNVVIQIIKVIWKSKNKNLLRAIKCFLIFMLAWILAYIAISILLIVFLIKKTNINLSIQIISSIKFFDVKMFFIFSVLTFIIFKVYQVVQNENNYQEVTKLIFIKNYYSQQNFLQQNLNQKAKTIISFIYVTSKI